MRRALRLVAIQARAAALQSMQYRLEFFVQAALGILWTAGSLLPLALVFRQRAGIGGWTWGEALVVVGFFTSMKGVLAGVLSPSMLAAVEHVRKGTLDFMLLKPADALLLISTSRFDFAALPELLVGAAISAWGVHAASREPDAAGVAFAAFLFACGAVVLWSLWVIAVSQAFHFVKIDNLSHLIVSTFDAARWPSTVYRGAFAVLFTFVFPLALMTTWPALALLSRATPSHGAGALALTAAFVLAARLTWRHALRKYTSAGG